MTFGSAAWPGCSGSWCIHGIGTGKRGPPCGSQASDQQGKVEGGSVVVPGCVTVASALTTIVRSELSEASCLFTPRRWRVASPAYSSSPCFLVQAWRTSTWPLPIRNWIFSCQAKPAAGIGSTIVEAAGCVCTMGPPVNAAPDAGSTAIDTLLGKPNGLYLIVYVALLAGSTATW